MISVRKQFLKNTLSGWLAQGSAALVGLIVFPYNIKHLGEDVFAINVLALSAIEILQYLNGGMGPALLRFFSQTVVAGDREELRTISTTSQCILGLLGLVGSMTILAGTPAFLDFYQVDPEYVSQTRSLLLCLSIWFFLGFQTFVFGNIVLARQRFDLLNINQVIGSWLRLGLIVLFYNLWKPSLAVLGWAVLVSGIYNYFSLFLLAYIGSGRSILFSFRHLRFSRLPIIASISIYSLIENLCFAASLQLPVLILGRTLGAKAVSDFYPGVIVSLLLGNLLAQMTAPLVPLASRDRLHEAGANLGRWAIMIGEVVACAGYGALLMTIFFLPAALHFWAEARFVPMAPTITILVVGVVFSSIQGVNYSLALGGSTIAPAAWSAVVAALFAALGTVIGTCWGSWGLLEIALWITVLRFVRSAVFLTWIYSRIFAYPFVEYVIRVYLRTAVPGVLLLAVGLLLKLFLPAGLPGFWILGLESVVLGILYAVLGWRLGLSAETKRFILGRNRDR